MGALVLIRCPALAQQPETEGGGIPVTAEEMSELMYKPLPGEWGEGSREEECDRIIAGIDRLITVGGCFHHGGQVLTLKGHVGF